MRERFSDEQLDAVLAGVGRHLVIPEGVTFVLPAGVLREERSTARLLALAAAVLLIALIGIGTLVAPVRDAVADWFGIGNTRVEQVPAGAGDPTGLPSFSAGAVPTTAAGAAARLGRPLPDVTDRALGRPELLAVPPEGGVVMAWAPGRTSLWVVPDDAGDAGALVKKLVTLEDTARPVTRLGEQAMVIDGGHVLETPARRVAAGRVVLWVEDGLQLRLESDLPLRRMLEVARSVRAPR
jgi:hypothetical protein